MDGRWLIAAMIAAAGCRGAAAAQPGEDAGVASADEPRHGIDVPADWPELPSISAATTAAAAAVLGKGAVVHAHAWGEPARGCFLAIVDASGARRETMASLLLELQQALTAHLDVSEWTTSPDAEDVAEVQARFVHAGSAMTGRLRAHLALDRQKVPRAVAAACFYNDRQPALCDNACAPLLTMLEPLTPAQAPP